MTMAINAVANPQNLPVAAGSFEDYMRLAYSLPVLSQEEECALATELHEHDDVEAARELVLRNLRFVIHVARGYSGYGLPLADLVQEGTIGLMKAVKRFDPSMGVRLVSFAVHWIRSEIHEYVLRNWRIVRMATTKAQRKLFFNLRKSRKRLGWMDDAEVRVVAEDLGVEASEVREMESRLSQPDIALDFNVDDDEGSCAPITYLAQPGADPAPIVEVEDSANVRSEQLHQALASLDDRSQMILKERWFAESKRTLHELAAEFGVSAERIRQVEAAAIKKLRQSLVPA